MWQYLPRLLESKLLHLLESYPAIVITGPRQVGKTTLVKHLQAAFPDNCVYLDLELPSDLGKLNEPELYLRHRQEALVIIDEVQRQPALFPVLRALIDQHRRPGRFILLGSASPELIRDTSESLAGRVAYLELHPFSIKELPASSTYHRQWLRGGFPESLLAGSDATSFDWRSYFIQSYLEKDLPLLGLSAAPLVVRRLWTMIAHLHGKLLNKSNLANSLDLTSPTIARYLDFMESAFLIRRLPAYPANAGKRLIKSPKVYVRDTGLLHALLNIETMDDLEGHPVLGYSWEGYVLQQLAALAPARTDLYFYRTSDGAEADIVIAPGGVPQAIVEVKYAANPTISRGFYHVARDLGIQRRYVITPSEESYPLDTETTLLSWREMDQVFAE